MNQQNAANAYAVALTSRLAKMQHVDEHRMRILLDELPANSQLIESIRITGLSQPWHFWRAGVLIIADRKAGPYSNRISIVQPVLTDGGVPKSNTASELEIRLAQASISTLMHYSLLVGLSVLNILFLLLINYRLKNESHRLLNVLQSTQTSANADGNKVTDTTSNNRMQLLPTLQDELNQQLIEAKSTHFNAPQIIQNIGNNKEVTQQQKIEQQELQLARKSAIHSSRLKNTIIANTSHELLTPLNSIAGFTELLLQQAIAPQQEKHYLKLIHDNALYVSSLVNDLVLFADNLNSKILLQYKTVQIEQLMASIGHTLADEANKKGLKFIVDTSTVRGKQVSTDPTRLRQIVNNLGINAIRYTEQGSISLKALLENQQLIITVSDTGKGIPADQQKRIFNAFASGNQTVSDNSPGLGLGLGLSIVRNLCSRMGAQIKLQSELGSGTSVSIIFPARDTEQVLKTCSQDSAKFISDNTITAQTKILVVDDNRANTLLLKNLLRHISPAETTIDTASNGEQALQLVDKTLYNWLFLDLRMHPMNGTTLLHKIRRRRNYLSAKSTAIACTAHTSDEEYQQLIAAGFDLVIHKPLSLDVLNRLFQPNNTTTCNVAAPIPDNAPHTDNEFFDPFIAVNKANGNIDIAREIFEQFVEETKLCINNKQLHNTEVSALIDSIHYLNGAAAIAAVPILKAHFEEIEAALKISAALTSDIKQQIEALEKLLFAFVSWCEQQSMEDLFSAASDTKPVT